MEHHTKAANPRNCALDEVLVLLTHIDLLEQHTARLIRRVSDLGREQLPIARALNTAAAELGTVRQLFQQAFLARRGTR